MLEGVTTPGFSYRDVRIFPPFPDEVPQQIVDAGGAVDDVRVAKLDGTVIGAYWLTCALGERFEIKALGVCERCRGRGVGRWLLRHAIGIAEVRGGRVIEVSCQAPAAFLQDSGFSCEDGVFRLRLTPE